ncbi:GTP pyrophosphokinase [Pseudoxanthomonas sp. PXM04]|uniref:GTP pyrophosphokinase n=1 Tax=Pseudoxanthomonas sp. PXM04 TaxID=2769297 RepID=UPI00178361AB|nr:GTP pyrophosphokinase [Pseudoxanthomonas sp. PXM04]MBD9378917.1 GTP pyrophosphokinase [Pseudoxanthomonas sp. PXM04]
MTTDVDVTNWLEGVLPRHLRLTTAVVGLIQSLLSGAEIDFLTVTGRTKSKPGALEKIDRKAYDSPMLQLTDLSGLRVVVYTESQVQRVSELISKAFNVDLKNSMDRDAVLRVDQTGYRSVHFVCDLGEQRAGLPEFNNLGGLKFEIQVRTVLQHAWAELAHDRNYKLGAKLPRELERKLYLYAGMLEIADKGFDEISRQIDEYAKNLKNDSKGQLEAAALDSLSIGEFFARWAESNKYETKTNPVADALIRELNSIGLGTIGELKTIEPEGFADRARRFSVNNLTPTGISRLWMLIHDWRKIVEPGKINWYVSSEDRYASLLASYIPEKELALMYEKFAEQRAKRDAEQKLLPKLKRPNSGAQRKSR